MVISEDTLTHIYNIGMKLKPFKDSYFRGYQASYQTTCIYVKDG